MVSFNIRKADPNDVGDIMDMIEDLARYLNCEDQVRLTRESFLEDGFGENKYFNCLVAELDSNDDSDNTGLIAYALYFYTYSTWEGRMLYMEDLYVSPEYRGEGVGSKLWKSVAADAVAKKCTRMQWVVANWSKSSIEYYKRNGAQDITSEEGWHVFRMNEPELETFSVTTRERNSEKS